MKTKYHRTFFRLYISQGFVEQQGKHKATDAGSLTVATSATPIFYNKVSVFGKVVQVGKRIVR